MNKIKKTTVFILLTIILAYSLAGCTKKPAEVESTEDSTVQVKIVDAYYRGSPHPATYLITVEYNGKQYYLIGYESYYLYHDKIGEMADALFRTTKWDNGNVTYDIVGLTK